MMTNCTVVDDAVISTVNALVAATTVGKQPSSTSIGPTTMPPPMPSSPAMTPQPKQTAGYTIVVRALKVTLPLPSSSAAPPSSPPPDSRVEHWTTLS
jgi:hypothetical protein